MADRLARELAPALAAARACGRTGKATARRPGSSSPCTRSTSLSRSRSTTSCATLASRTCSRSPLAGSPRLLGSAHHASPRRHLPPTRPNNHANCGDLKSRRCEIEPRQHHVCRLEHAGDMVFRVRRALGHPPGKRWKARISSHSDYAIHRREPSYAEWVASGGPGQRGSGAIGGCRARPQRQNSENGGHRGHQRQRAGLGSFHRFR
jgi:hypothetical protein